MRQVLYNLVGNAIKFSARDDESGRVAVRVVVASAVAAEVAFTITDNGIGMSHTLEVVHAIHAGGAHAASAGRALDSRLRATSWA